MRSKLLAAAGSLLFALASVGLVLWRKRRAARPRPDWEGSEARFGASLRTSEYIDRFADGARSALQFAHEEAHRRRHAYIGADHLLLGLVGDPEGIPARSLAGLGVAPERVAKEFHTATGWDARTPPSRIDVTPEVKRAIELAADEARRLRSRQIGPEHLLLGLLAEGQSQALSILEGLGASRDAIRAAVAHNVRQVR